MPRARFRPARSATVAVVIAASLVAGAVRAAPSTQALDAELSASPLAARTGAPAAWAYGATGTRSVVAIIDSGVLATHRELLGRVLTGHDAVRGGIDTGDAVGHGTHVAALIAGARDGRGIVGVAPDAMLLPVQVLSGGVATDATLSAGIRWAASRAGILNLSLAATAPIAGAALRDAVSGGALVVVAAGNRGAANPDWPARYARESWANGASARGAMIVVGAVDDAGRIASFSNRAGDTARWYLVAPGESLVSASAAGPDAMTTQSGTSMSAPAVSGAAALLQSMWPRLGAKDIASILLATARDLGAPGTDPVYGRGLLDVDAALRPVGELSTVGARGTLALSAAGLRLSPATAGLARVASSGGLVVVATDAYRRDYTTDLASRIVAPLPQQVVRAFDAMDRRMERLQRDLPGGATLSLQPGDAFSLIGRDAAGDYAFGAGARASDWFGVAAGLDVAALANPYASLATRGAMVGRGLTFGDTTIKAGVIGGSSTETSGIGWTRVDARSTLLEASRRISDTLLLTTTWSRTVEQGAWLGAIGSGAFASDDTVRTDAIQLGAAWTVAPRLTLAGAWSRARTGAHRASGLFDDVGATSGDAATVAIIQRDTLRTGDALSLSVSQPMRTRDGSVSATLQTGVDADGNAILETRRFALAPSGREQIVELGWRTPLGRAAAIGATVAVRMQPNHDASAPTDTLMAVRYRLAF